jgi:glycerol kinase
MKQLGFITSLADLDRVAAPDAGGVLAVPALGGLGAPWWRPGAKAHVSGMTRFTTVGHLVVAILQGVAAQIAALGSTVAVGVGQPLSRLRVDGNLTGCTTLMQALADLMQLDVEVRPTAHTAALGAAVVARIAVNPALSLSEAIRVPEPSTVFTPRWSSDQAIEFCSRWAEAAKAA